ncbi:MAG: hypothetical protein MUF54_13930 [Polyangiaceae bacterium]|nr:hypothetical protein [Polyangiaceae bacterium]
MAMLPDCGNMFAAGHGSILRIPVLFGTPGSCVVWLHGYRLAGKDNSLYVGLDGVCARRTSPLQGCSTSEWSWSSSERTDSGDCWEAGAVTPDVPDPAGAGSCVLGAGGRLRARQARGGD